MSPDRRLIWLLLALAGLAVALIWRPGLALAWQLAALGVAALVLADLLMLRRQALPEVARKLAANLPQGAWSPVQLRLRNATPDALRLFVHDAHPSEFDVRGQPAPAQLAPGQALQLTYKVRPRRRGDAEFGPLEIARRSPFGLWWQKRRVGDSQQVQVFPNFAEVARYSLLAMRNQLGAFGVRLQQRRGQGSEFHQLRDYQVGDTLRQIDWKATARYRRPISREYREEKDQRVVFLLDCGSRMRHQGEGGAHLDDALNAMLLTAHVAVREGDAAGFLTFGGSRRWYPPRKGKDAVTRLLHALYDVQSGVSASDYLDACARLMRAERRRALIVLITNSRAEAAPDLVKAVRLMARRHLVIVADLRERELDEQLEQPIQDLDGALAWHGLRQWRDARGELHERLRLQGVEALDLLPRQLPLALVNEYLRVKQSGRL